MPPPRRFQTTSVTLVCGECNDYRPSETVTACCTDPPYGSKNDCDYTRFSGGISQVRNYHKNIVGDDEQFDPALVLTYPKVCIWGFQFFASTLPTGTVLVWNKKPESNLGKFLSDCELAWVKGNKGCYLFNHIWDGFNRASERGKTLHPTQKPVALWKWVFEKLKLKPGDLVYDPYMGAGGCGVACVESGLRYYGVEIERSYFDIAVKRLESVTDA